MLKKLVFSVLVLSGCGSNPSSDSQEIVAPGGTTVTFRSVLPLSSVVLSSSRVCVGNRDGKLGVWVQQSECGIETPVSYDKILFLKGEPDGEAWHVKYNEQYVGHYANYGEQYHSGFGMDGVLTFYTREVSLCTDAYVNRCTLDLRGSKPRIIFGQSAGAVSEPKLVIGRTYELRPDSVTTYIKKRLVTSVDELQQHEKCSLEPQQVIKAKVLSLSGRHAKVQILSGSQCAWSTGSYIYVPHYSW